MNANTKPILVIGGGIAGITAALEAAEVGYNVILIEKEAYLGGRVVRMYRYFPKMCPPTCGYEINIQRIRQNPRISVYTQTKVKEITGKAGNFRTRLQIQPRYMTGLQAPSEEVLSNLISERDNDFNYGITKRKALYLAHDMAYPYAYVIDKEALSDDDAITLLKESPEGTIDLNQTERDIEIDVGSVIIATGWSPYDASKLDNLGYGLYPNVISNVMMERLASDGGPTEGQIIRPSDSKIPENIAFVQCAGSRDENHLPYCSAVCCMASLKQARYIREKNENAKVTIFYIDIRSIGRHESFYYEMIDDANISFVKGKVAAISEDSNNNLILDVEDTLAREKLHDQFDMVILATGMVPNRPDFDISVGLKYDDYGFVQSETTVEGIFATGCAKHPCDVSSSTKKFNRGGIESDSMSE